MRHLAVASVSICISAGCTTETPSIASQARQALLQQSSASSLLRKYPEAQTYLSTVQVSNALAFQRDIDSQGPKAATLMTQFDSLDKDLQKQFRENVEYCGAILADEAGRVDKSRGASLAIQIIGALAGSIAVPALAAKHAAASVIALAGGVSGVSNTLQNSIKDVGSDPASLYNVREQLRQSVIKDVTDFQAGLQNYPQNAVAEAGILDHMKALCVFMPISAPISLPSEAGGNSKPTKP